MFKPGDKVFCVDNTNIDLELNVIYNIIKVTEHVSYTLVILLGYESYGFYYTRFVSVKKIRKDKMICIERKK